MAYTTAIKVRNLLPDLLIETDSLGESHSGTHLVLTNPAFNVLTILKDTTTLVLNTDFTFVQPQTITLGVAATGENYIATVHIAFSDAEIDTFIGESDRVIDAKFFNLESPTSEYQDDWSKYLSAAKILRVKSHGNEDMLAWADSMKEIALSGMDSYQAQTTVDAFEADGVVVRSDKESVPDFQFDQSGTTDAYGDSSD